jgi:hypothetical protein
MRAKRIERLPVVLARQEVEALLVALDGVPQLMAMADMISVRCRSYSGIDTCASVRIGLSYVTNGSTTRLRT